MPIMLISGRQALRPTRRQGDSRRIQSLPLPDGVNLERLGATI